MDQKQPTNRKIIFLWAASGFLLLFLGFLFLKASPWGGQFYHNPWIHVLLLLTVCAVAFFASFVAYKGYKENQAINLFIISLAFYTFGFVFFLHGITVPDTGLFSEALFDITEHYGLFLGSFILFGLILPMEELQEFFYRRKSKIFWGWTTTLLAAFIALIIFPPLAETLERVVDLFVGLTIPLIVIPLFSMLFSYQRSKSSLLFYFIIALAILVNSAIVPFFYEEWNFLWWYFHFTFLLSFLIILFCLLKYRREKGKIIKAFKTFAKMRSKLMVVFLLVGLLPLGVFGYLHLQSSRVNLEKEISDKLLLFAEAKEGQVFAYLDALESRTLDFASDGFVKDALEKIIQTGSKQAVEDLNKYLINDKQILDPAIVGIMIIDLKGKVISATDEEEIGDDESDDEYFIEGQKGIFTIEVKEKGGHFGSENPLVVAAPIAAHETGELLGVFVNIFKTEKLHDILSGEFQIAKGAMSSREGQPETMETYLVDNGKRMLTHPHKKHFTVTIVDTLPVKKCLEEQKEIFGAYLNYTGKEVIGASMCITGRGWTLAAEMSAKEAFASIRETQQRLVLLVLLFGALITGLAAGFSLTITTPIKKLHHGAEKIGAGDLNYRFDIKTGDEIEQLAEEFNSMAGKIQKRNQELSEGLGRLQSLVESVKLGVVMVDLNLNVILTNSSAKTIFGKSEQESLTFSELEEKLKNVNLSQALSYYVQDGKPVNIKEVKFGDKYFRLFLSAVRDVTEKQFIGAVMIIEDITEQKFIDRMRTEIASTTSHQLRTPLSVIKGNLEMILGGDFGKISGRQKEILQEIFLGNERMIHLVNALMDVAKIDEGKLDLDLKPVKLEELVAEAVKGLLPFAEKNHVALSYQPPAAVLPEINVDSQKIRQAVQNIVENSIKYSQLDHQGRVEVKVEKDESGKFLRIVVKDNGVGIPKDEQGKIFQRFFRGSNTVSMDPGGGSGIGLFIDKAAIERHGGKIWFESEGEGKGTTFYFILPITK